MKGMRSNGCDCLHTALESLTQYISIQMVHSSVCMQIVGRSKPAFSHFLKGQYIDVVYYNLELTSTSCDFEYKVPK